jgi:hypothetical protein
MLWQSCANSLNGACQHVHLFPLSQRCGPTTTIFALGPHTGHSLLVAMTKSVALNDFHLVISLFISFSLLFRNIFSVFQM